jgi:hypothetical protein
MSADYDDVRLGRCPRCDSIDPRQTRDGPDFAGDEDLEPFEEDSVRSEIFGRCFKLKRCSVCGLGGVARNPIRGGYFKRDLLEVVDELPMMGRPCYHCGVRIPKFLDLETEDHYRIYKLARSSSEDAAVDELVKVMGCPREWARLWVTHPFGPKRPARVWVGPPCVRCGRPLRTRLARQCLECGLDWHDHDEPSMAR